MLAALLNEGIGLSIGTDDMPDKRLFDRVLRYPCPIQICSTRTHSWKMEFVEQRDLEFAVSHIVMLVSSKFTRIWSYNFPPSTPGHRPEF